MTADLPTTPLPRTTDGRMRVLVVSHACTVDVNRDVYRALARTYGHDVHVVVPAGWPVAFAGGPQPEARPADDLSVYQLPVRLAGRIQQHFYRWRRVRAAVRMLRPDVLLIEEESFSIAGTQWAAVARWNKLPYALQSAENLVGRVPRWLRPVVDKNLTGAGLVMARSHSAISVVRRWGATGAVEFLPHALPEVLTQQDTATESAQNTETAPFTIGFAGRLVAEKGIEFMVDALLGLDAPRDVRLVVAGRGAEDQQLDRLDGSGVEVERVALAHDRMGDFYRQLDVLLVPSRTTGTWTEQFGRVITEAACFGVPTIGSDSGEISWVVGDLRAGTTLPENDTDLWRTALLDLIDERTVVDHEGLRARALERYSTPAVAARTDAALTTWMGES
jgi:glycosyltransferase involved in cell wall biosynthesis